MMLKENVEALRDNEKMLFGPKFEDVVTKSLTSKNEWREFFSNLKEHGLSSGNKESRKQQLLHKPPLLPTRGNREYSNFTKGKKVKIFS